MDPNQIAAAIAVMLNSKLSPSLAVFVVLVWLFYKPVKGWIDSSSQAKLLQAQVHGATLDRLTTKVDGVAPAVITEVKAAEARTTAAVESVGEELGADIAELGARLPKTCPLPSAARPPTCPVTPRDGVVIPPEPGKASS